MRRSLRAALAIVATMVACGSARADADGCGPVRDAIAKLEAAPRLQQRGLVTRAGTGRSYSTELQAFEDKEYERQRDGAWRVGPRTQVPLVVDGQAAIFDCRRAGTDVSDGVAMTIYAYKRLMSQPRIVRDVRLWVVDSTGMATRSQVEIASGKDRGRAEYTFRYDPDAVPPVAGKP